MTHTIDTDVLVIGAGAAGIPAAIAAARAGARVILLEDDACPGGAPVDQYVLMPDGGPRSGIVSELLGRLAGRYALTDRPANLWWNFWYLPGDYLCAVSELLAAEPNLRVLCGARAEGYAVSDAPRLHRVEGAYWRGADGAERRVRARVTIDATGTGALAFRAGADARYGEDSRDDFGEAIAPPQRTDTVQLCTWQYVSQRIGQAAPMDMSRLKLSFPLESGHGWPRKDVQGLMARDAGAYLHWGCRVRCGDTRDPQSLADTQRQALEMMREDLALLRANGYAVHLAPRIGVREQWRIMGEAVVTANDLFAGTIPDDSVLITQRPIDIWREGHTMADYPETKPYGVPYRALLPKGLDGLLVVGKHMSGSHLAMGSYRVQCLLGQIGQAAGVAAALCARSGASPRALDFAPLRRAMTAAPQNLILDASRCIPPTE